MAKTITLTGRTREGIGRTAAKGLRNEGKVPAVLYGQGEPKAVELTTAELSKAISTVDAENVVVELSLEDAKSTHLALIKDLQVHPLRDTVIHLDFHEIDKDKLITADVAVHEIGDCEGLKQGGMLEIFLRHLHVECKPMDLPSVIEVNITNLQVNESVLVSDIQVPEGVKILNPADVIVFTVQPPRVKGCNKTEAASAES